MKKIINIFKMASIQKLILISVLLFVIISLIVFGPLIYKNHIAQKAKDKIEKIEAMAAVQKKETEDTLGVLKKWSNLSQSSFGAKEIRLETKWVDEYIMYKFQIDFEGSKNTSLKSKNRFDGFNIYFIDSDGFRLFSFRVALSDMTNIVNDNGMIIGKDINAKKQVTAALYQKFSEWNFEWDF